MCCDSWPRDVQSLRCGKCSSSYLSEHRSTERWPAAAVAGNGAPETGRRGAQPRGNSIRLSPSPSMQGQEGRVDRDPEGEEGWCPGLLLTSSSSSVSSSSLFSPSSPPRVRIKTQLLRGMQGGAAGEEGRSRKYELKSLRPKTLLLFPPCVNPVSALPPRSDFYLVMISLSLSLSLSLCLSIPLSLSFPSLSLSLSPLSLSLCLSQAGVFSSTPPTSLSSPPPPPPPPHRQINTESTKPCWRKTRLQRLKYAHAHAHAHTCTQRGT